MSENKDTNSVFLSEQNKQLQERNLALQIQNQELADQNKNLLDELKRKETTLSELQQSSSDQKSEKIRNFKFKLSTVLFSQVKDFTLLTSHEKAETIIDTIERFFYQFDSIIRKYNIEKIKSIGDCYVCAGGIPRKNRTNPIEVVLAALEMISNLRRLQAEADKNWAQLLNLTFGIHSGPVAISETGLRKIAYDVTGDTVNIASRISASNNTELISISANTYEHVKDFFICQYNGKMPIKFKGDMALYNIMGIRPELTVDGKGITPNNLFRVKLQLVRFEDIQDYVIEMLERDLPKHLSHRIIKHTIDVTIGVEIIGSGENVSDEEMLLLKTAAIFHDSGFIHGHYMHEAKGCEIAQKILAEYGYSTEQITIINQLISVTNPLTNPTTILQKIIHDANLDYYGRKDFINTVDAIYNELKHENLVGSQKDWYHTMINAVSTHDFYTQSAQNMRQISKQQQIDKLKALIG